MPSCTELLVSSPHSPKKRQSPTQPRSGQRQWPQPAKSVEGRSTAVEAPNNDEPPSPTVSPVRFSDRRPKTALKYHPSMIAAQLQWKNEQMYREYQQYQQYLAARERAAVKMSVSLGTAPSARLVSRRQNNEARSKKLPSGSQRQSLECEALKILVREQHESGRMTDRPTAWVSKDNASALAVPYRLPLRSAGKGNTSHEQWQQISHGSRAASWEQNRAQRHTHTAR